MSWLNGSFFFGVEHPGFLKEGVKTYLMTPILPLNSPTFFIVASIVYANFCRTSDFWRPFENFLEANRACQPDPGREG
jgi:hypothetical protein